MEGALGRLLPGNCTPTGTLGQKLHEAFFFVGSASALHLVQERKRKSTDVTWLPTSSTAASSSSPAATSMAPPPCYGSGILVRWCCCCSVGNDITLE